MDVFLTPLFGKWLPRHCNDFNVGGGAWWHEFSEKRLKQAANRLGLKYGGVRDLGSTWYSTPDQIRLVSYLTLFAITYLSIEEFTHVERQERIHNWPEWHYMVSIFDKFIELKISADFFLTLKDTKKLFKTKKCPNILHY